MPQGSKRCVSHMLTWSDLGSKMRIISTGKGSTWSTGLNVTACGAYGTYNNKPLAHRARVFSIVIAHVMGSVMSTLATLPLQSQICRKFELVDVNPTLCNLSRCRMI